MERVQEKSARTAAGRLAGSLACLSRCARDAGPRHRPPRGQIIPMILIVMVIMAILGLAVLFTGTSDYAQSALVVYGLKAEQLSLAALDEAQAALYEMYNAPVQPLPAHRKKLLDTIRAKVGSSDATPLPEIDLLADGKVARSAALATAGGGKLEAVTVQFYGFRRLKYQPVKGSGDDLFRIENVYYHDPTRNFDKAGLQTPEDFVGFYSIKARASYGKLSRELTVTHDVKLVDVSPPAREFALFSFYSANTESPGGPPATYSLQDLNKGGGFKVFANGASRIFVRGPFLVEPEDVPNGAGGRTPPTCSSYPPEEGRQQREHWWGWAAVPAIRDAMLDRAGWSAFSLAVGPKRPEKETDERFVVLTMASSLIGSLPNAIPFFNDDAGWYILESRQQPQWYAGVRAVDPKNQSFSLVGDPQDAANGGFNPFLGLLWKYTDKRECVGDSTRFLGPDKRSWVEPTPDAERDTFFSIEAEGALIGAYNRIKFERYHGGLNDVYRCTVQDQVRTPFGYRWEKSYERGWFDKVFGDLFAVATFYVLGPIGGTLGLAVLDGFGLMPFGAATPPPNLSSVTPADVTSVFPPNYKIYQRAATRRYPTLEQILPPPDTRKPLVLDGVIWADDLSSENPFTYKGRGIVCSGEVTAVASGTVSSAARGPKLALPIVPAQPAGASPTEALDYLTLVNTRDESGKSHLAEQQLEFTFVPEAGDSSASVFQGSVLSLQGVRPKEHTVSIAGNLVCGFVNKAAIPEGARLNVVYNTTLLKGLDPAAAGSFQDGSWHVISLSPRVSGWHDR